MTETATFAGGCFWCVEAAFERVRGVETVVSGYAGGHVDDPTYQQVCAGTTGHAEAVQVTYDPAAVGYEDLLEVFFTIHDPTTKDREGPDVGSQYRSAVYYHDDDQRDAVEAYIDHLEETGEYRGVVTEVEPLDTFYEAEDKHQNYYDKALTADGEIQDAYCSMYVPPKINKMEDKHPDKVESDD